MVAGTGLGLLAYFQIGFYVAALVSCGVSLVVTAGVSLLDGRTFDFDRLALREGTS